MYPHLLCSKQRLGGASAALLQNSMQVPGRVASAVGHNPCRMLQSYSPRLAKGLLPRLFKGSEQSASGLVHDMVCLPGAQLAWGHNSVGLVVSYFILMIRQ